MDAPGSVAIWGEVAAQLGVVAWRLRLARNVGSEETDEP
jgi:hypothetical protein